MTLADQIKALRIRLGDAAKPYLWSDDELTLFLNEATSEACERGQLILDIDTPEVVEIQITPGQSTYCLHPSILNILRAKLDNGERPLVETSTQQMDEGGIGWFPTGLSAYPGAATWYPGGSNWETLQGNPERYIRNDRQSIRLIRIPVEADVLRLRVTRLPLCPMKRDTDEPEIAHNLHFRLLDWAMRCAYLKQDAEVFDQKAADAAELRFIASFGQRPDANVQRKRRDGRSHVVQMGTW